MTICRDAIHRVLTQGCVPHAEALQTQRDIERSQIIIQSKI
ncbi:MAG: hypothetical protein RMY62_011210 [Nostoc sp. ZfuVER08]|nr:hypothetical protein [Nostoc sp. ZfuVER08]